MPFIPRTSDEILAGQIDKLTANTPITNFSAGARARLILELIDDDVSDFEDTLSFNMAMSFVSQAMGAYLDLIGELLDCQRRPDEDDENYRYRICHQVYVVAGANEIALRLACLSVDGVRDVNLVPFTHGTGSFSVYVIPEDSLLTEIVVPKVQDVINAQESHGVKGVAISPKLIPVRIGLNLIGRGGADTVGLRPQVSEAIRFYIENLPMGTRPEGQKLIINALENAIMDVSEDIEDVEIYSLTLNGRRVLIQNQTNYWDEKFSIDYPDIEIGG